MQTDWNDNTSLASNTYHKNHTNYNSQVNFRDTFLVQTACTVELMNYSCKNSTCSLGTFTDTYTHTYALSCTSLYSTQQTADKQY